MMFLRGRGVKEIPRVLSQERSDCPTPSPGTPGEGGGEGPPQCLANGGQSSRALSLTLSRSTGRGNVWSRDHLLQPSQPLNRPGDSIGEHGLVVAAARDRDELNRAAPLPQAVGEGLRVAEGD